MREFTTYMDIALAEARLAGERGETPVGAVIIANGEILAQNGNRTRELCDPTAHAEILVIRAACAALGSERLPSVDLYVTLEPCPMCAGAAVWARLDRIVYGAPDPKAGAAWSLYNIPQDRRLNHRIELVEGVLAAESSDLLKEFFAQRR